MTHTTDERDAPTLAEAGEKQQTSARLAFSISECIVALRSSRRTVYALIAAGTLRTYRIGKRRYVSARALDELIEKLEATTAAERAL